MAVSKPLSKEQALKKAATFCSMQEHCRQEATAKLKAWGIDSGEAAEIIDFLIDEKYIDEKRYAAAFVRGKFRMKKWGKIKIANELRQKMIPNPFISQALLQIEESEYLQTLEYLMDKKTEELNGSSKFEKKSKILNYLLSKGFEADLIYSLLKQRNYDEVD